MVRPTTCLSRPLRTVSTSGSSGTDKPPAGSTPPSAVGGTGAGPAPAAGSGAGRAPFADWPGLVAPSAAAVPFAETPPAAAAEPLSFPLLIAFQAASAACCSASFFDRPDPDPYVRPPTRTDAR